VNEFRDFLREREFFARAVTFGMIPVFFKISLLLGWWYGYGGNLPSLKLFGAIGILTGSFVGHQLYYRWIFPEKRQSVKP
jgi:hypothetical protein